MMNKVTEQKPEQPLTARRQANPPLSGEVSADSTLTDNQMAVLLQQQRIGNQAVMRKIRQKQSSVPTTRGVVQRDYLDQKDKKEAFRAATKNIKTDGKAIQQVMEALGQYEQAVNGIDTKKIEKALQNLEKFVVLYLFSDVSPTLIEILKQLTDEIKIVQLDLDYCQQSMARIELAKEGKWGKTSIEISKQMETLKEMKQKYGTKKELNRLETAQNGMVTLINEAMNATGKIENKFIEDRKLSQEQYKYGDPETGEIDEETQSYLDDFEKISEFLAQKDLVLKCLFPLAKAIAGDENKMQAMNRELSLKEKSAGLSSSPLVPLGILPGDVFVGLLQSGNVLDDFGAGLQHGESSHRLQWYALITFMETNNSSFKHAPDELFKTINKPPFSPDRKGNTMWGTIFDKGINASEKSYSFPGTLNRDLLEAGYNNKEKKLDKSEPGLTLRDSNYKSPNTEGLEPIGEALIQLRQLRIKQAQEVIGEEALSKDTQWQLFGTPPSELATHIGKTLEQENYEMADEGNMVGGGSFSSKTTQSSWKVLKEKETGNEGKNEKEKEEVIIKEDEDVGKNNIGEEEIQLQNLINKN